MGVWHYVYLGPYLECEYQVIEAQQSRNTCGNLECNLHGAHYGEAASFCSSCGRPLISIPEAIKKVSVNRFTLVDEVNQALYFINMEGIELDRLVDIWIPNVDRDAPRGFHVNPLTDLQVTPIGLVIDEERAWLRQSFVEEIDTLRRHYQRCGVKWGLIVYAY